MTEEKEWIESPDGWNELEEENDIEEEYCYGQELFADQESSRLSYTFRFEDGKTIRISGFDLHSEETTRSTGVTLWEGSEPLANYLVKHSNESVEGRKVLELGSGLGLCGIVAHHLGAARVVLTDGDSQTLHELRNNVKENCGDALTVSCRQLFWGNYEGSCARSEFLESFGTFDTIIASDVIYTPTSIAPLFDTIQWAMKKPDGCFLLSWFTRVNDITIEAILEAAGDRNMKWTETKEGIYVFTLRR